MFLCYNSRNSQILFGTMVSLRALLAGFALITAPVVAAVGPVEVGKVLKDLDSEVTSLQPVAESINADNAALLPQGGGPLPVLFDGFSRIIKDFKFISVTVETGGSCKSRTGGRPRTSIGTDGSNGMRVSKAYTQFLQHTGDLLNTLRGRAPMLQGSPAAIPPMVDAISELKHEYEGIAGSIDRIEKDGDNLSSGITAKISDCPQEGDESSDDDDTSDEEDSSEDDDSSDDEDSSEDEDEGSDDEDQGLKQAFGNTRDILDAVLIAYKDLLGHSVGKGPA